MPNTLAHFGVEGLVIRRLLRGSDLKWIYVSCIIPDLPWIFQRVAHVAIPRIDPFDLRLYVTVQASLFFSLILGAALSMFSVNTWRTLSILSMGATLHLIMDALQTKWGNGVHLFAPFDWTLWNAGLFWPEDFPTLALTGFGLLYFLNHLKRTMTEPVDFLVPRGRKLLLMAGLLVAYFAGPLLMTQFAEHSDSHYVKILREKQLRIGRYIEIDRANYKITESGGKLEIFSGEKLDLVGVELNHPASISVRGRFVGENRINVEAWHLHSINRDYATYLGLSLLATVWIVGLFRQYIDRK